MTAFSIGSVYRVVRLTQVPLVESERYTARMFSLPLTIMIVIAAVEIDGYLKRASLSVWHRVLALAALAGLAIDVSAGLRLWRVLISGGLFGHAQVDLRAAALGNHADPVYTATVLAGLALTILTGAVLAVLVIRERRSTIVVL